MTHCATHRTEAGFTLLELLIGVAIMGVIMLAFTQLFSGSLRASSDINARNELLSEGQIAQQLIVSRLKGASYVYPPNTSFTMTNTVRTQNTIRGDQNWTVGMDPIVAMIVPPEGNPDDPNPSTSVQCNSDSVREKNMCFMFYAYYPIERKVLIEGINPKFAPDPDPANEKVWLLMEYRARIYDFQMRSHTNRLASAPTPNTVLARMPGRPAQILVDYVEPTSGAQPPLFAIQNDGSVAFNLRMQRTQRGKTLELPPLNVRAYPRNAPMP